MTILCKQNYLKNDIWDTTLRKTILCLKKCHKNKWHLCLENNIFTKLSQNMCLINIHIFIYQRTKRDCKLWNVCLKFSISTKLSQIVVVINLINIKLPDMIVNHERSLDLAVSLFTYINDHSYLKCVFFTKLSQIVV